MVVLQRFVNLSHALSAARILIGLAIPISGAYFLWTRPANVPEAPTLEEAARQTSAETKTAARGLAWYEPLWTRNLKESVIPKAADPKPAPTPENLPVLLATLVEPGGRFAHFANPAGAPRMRALHETIDRFRITEIEPGRVQLETADRSVWVEIPKPRN